MLFACWQKTSTSVFWATGRSSLDFRGLIWERGILVTYIPKAECRLLPCSKACTRVAEGNGLGPCAHESSGELDESSGVGPERAHPWAQGDGSTAGPQTTLRLGIKRPEDHCFLFLATKCLTRNEVTIGV